MGERVGEAVAVLVGDILLSRGMLMALEHDEFLLIKINSKAVKMLEKNMDYFDHVYKRYL